MVTEDSTATEHLSLETVDAVKDALRQAETLFEALDAFEIDKDQLINLGEADCLPADTIFYALVERGIAVTRKAIAKLDPTLGDVADG